MGSEAFVNVAERSIRAVDRVQQRNRVAGFVFGVVKKFGDDRGSQLAVLLTYYGFMSLFPLLLILTTILGFIGNERLSDSVVGTTLAQFPVFGEQIGEDAAHPISGNGAGLVIGLLFLFYGTLGFAQTAQHTMAEVWNVPGVVRPGFLPRLARSVSFFAVLGLGLVVATIVSGFATGRGNPGASRALAFVLTIIVNTGLFLAVFRVLTPRSVATRDLWPGALFGGLGYSILLAFGTALVQHQLRQSQALYGQFAFVLGLMAWLYLVSQLAVYAAELNVVRARRLWPRSMMQPPLTPADEQVLRDLAYQEERRPEQRVGVGFAPDAAHEAAADASRMTPERRT
jgi:YihY family inner membrane protein